MARLLMHACRGPVPLQFYGLVRAEARRGRLGPIDPGLGGNYQLYSCPSLIIVGLWPYNRQ